MLYSRAGDYPPGQPELYGEAFSTNSPEGACPHCHGIGRIYDATEQTMVPDDSLTIRERAIAAWPNAWGGQNQRDILVTLGYDVDRPCVSFPERIASGFCSRKNSQPFRFMPVSLPKKRAAPSNERRSRAIRELSPAYADTFFTHSPIRKAH
jgi:excinuclease ABC subunit A